MWKQFSFRAVYEVTGVTAGRLNEIKRLPRQTGYRMTGGAAEKVARLSSRPAVTVFGEIRLLLFRRLVSQMDTLENDVFVITAADVPDQ